MIMVLSFEFISFLSSSISPRSIKLPFSSSFGFYIFARINSIQDMILIIANNRTMIIGRVIAFDFATSN